MSTRRLAEEFTAERKRILVAATEKPRLARGSEEVGAAEMSSGSCLDCS